MVMAKLKTFVSARVRKCRKIMKEQSLDYLIVVDPRDIRYLTGFSGDDSILVVSARNKFMVSDARFVVQLRDECPGLSVKLRSDIGIVLTIGQLIFGKDKKEAKKLQAKIVCGVFGGDITVVQNKTYKKALGRSLKITDQSIPRMLRIIKDEYEVSLIRKAGVVASKSLNGILSMIKSGMTELEVTALLEYEMMNNGSTAAAFPTITAFGAHAAQCHATPGKTRLRKSQSLLIDFGATVGGYRSDLTRCFVVGKISPVFADAYKCVLEAQLAGIAAIKPGVTMKEVDAATRKPIPGRFPMYGHGTGHGHGLEIHEEPYLSHRNEKVLEEGMVITVEPGIYVTDKFGIRIEDDVLVTARGAKVLTKLDKSLESVCL